MEIDNRFGGTDK